MLRRLIFVVVAAAGIAAAQDPPTLVGRLNHVEGSVSFQPGGVMIGFRCNQSPADGRRSDLCRRGCARGDPRPRHRLPFGLADRLRVYDLR